jgi:DNA-binding transcriptional regulator YiaG
MGYTSTEVKSRYNKKTYKQFSCQIRNETFDKIEAIRTNEGLSRTEFIKMLVSEKYNIQL